MTVGDFAVLLGRATAFGKNVAGPGGEDGGKNERAIWRANAWTPILGNILISNVVVGPCILDG
jgi:hypothetical protein